MTDKPTPDGYDYSFSAAALRAARQFAIGEPRQFDRIASYIYEQLDGSKLDTIRRELQLPRMTRKAAARVLALGVMAGQIQQHHNQKEKPQ